MSIYRLVHSDFWTDTKVSEDFTAEDKYFMLYLLTNLHSKQCGCYEISLNQIAYEMGWTREVVMNEIQRFQNNHKIIYYNKQTRELLVKNWYRYNWTHSPKYKKLISDEISYVKNYEFREMLHKQFERFYNGGEEEEEALEIKTEQMSFEEKEPIDDDDQIENGFDPIEGDLEKPTCEDVQKDDSKPPYEEIVRMYHDICISYPKIIKLSPKRKGFINARWAETGKNIEIFRELFERMERSSFLKGNNGHNWAANFDWVLLPSNFLKIMEGNYDDKKPSKIQGGWNAIRQAANGGEV